METQFYTRRTATSEAKMVTNSVQLENSSHWVSLHQKTSSNWLWFESLRSTFLQIRFFFLFITKIISLKKPTNCPRENQSSKKGFSFFPKGQLVLSDLLTVGGEVLFINLKRLWISALLFQVQERSSSWHHQPMDLNQIQLSFTRGFYIISTRSTTGLPTVFLQGGR